VLVTGATGFVGQHIVQQLSAAGFSPVPVYRNRTKFEDMFPAFTGESLKWDLGQPATASIANTVSSCDAVVHAAAVLQGGDEGDRAVLQGNLLQSLHLISAIPKSCKQIVFISSTAVYGSVEKAVELVRPEPSSVYGVAKLATERLVDLFAREAGLSVVNLRVSAVYGPGMPEERAIPKFIRSLFAGGSITMTPGAFELANYIHVQDVVSTIVKCLNDTEPVNGTYNIAATTDQSLAEILDQLETLTGETAKREVVDTDRSPRGLPKHVSTDHAQVDLSFNQSMSIRDGLQEMITEHRSARL
jgi:UDP-glucose 4-epimerase